MRHRRPADPSHGGWAFNDGQFRLRWGWGEGQEHHQQCHDHVCGQLLRSLRQHDHQILPGGQRPGCDADQWNTELSAIRPPFGKLPLRGPAAGHRLGSTSITTSATGTKIAELRYKACPLRFTTGVLCNPYRVLRKGETRYTSGMTPTKYQFQGQFSNMAEFGLVYMKAR
jgi:hypothetical protein